MREFDRQYLELLSEKYPNEAAACSELINLSSILALPKGTEHFISDLHGEYAAVSHILNNCSGVILEKVLRLFREELGESQCHALCSVIYYPQEELEILRERGKLDESSLRDIIEHLRALTEMLSSKYTRSYVRRRMPQDWEFVLDELLHMQRDEDANQFRYHDAIIAAIVDSGAAESLIVAMATLIKRLAVDRLHVVGDIFDRGPDPASIIERLMEQTNMGQPRHSVAGRRGRLPCLCAVGAAHQRGLSQRSHAGAGLRDFPAAIDGLLHPGLWGRGAENPAPGPDGAGGQAGRADHPAPSRLWHG